MNDARKRDPEWKEFEKSVAMFVSALSPTSVVTHNLKQPDKHHGRLRQRDVWVKSQFLGHYPLVALISCKRWKRKLSTTDVEHFEAELRNSGANLGVLYSYSGFSKGAIEKAKALNIPCCQLFEGCAPSIPLTLPIVTLACRAETKLELIGNLPRDIKGGTWGNLLCLRLDETTSILDAINCAYLTAEESSANSVTQSKKIPQPFLTRISIDSATSVSPSWLQIRGRWKFFRAITEAHIINGSYEFTQGDFKGSIETPWIDRFDPNFGPGWELLENPPNTLENCIVLIFRIADIRPRLLHSLEHISIALPVPA